MRIGREWDKRIEIWLDELKKDFYEVIGEAKCTGFTTLEMMKPEEALSHDFIDMPEGTEWGRKWEYGWFRAEITSPAVAEGRRVVFIPGTGGEMLFWVNGKITGSVDLKHDYITLTADAVAGEHFEILFESYAGHGPRLENGGPYPPERVPVPEPPEYQQRVKQSVYAVWNEEAFQLWLDAYTLYMLLSELDDTSLRAQKIVKGLKEFTYCVDFEQALDKRRKNYTEAAKILKPLLACANGSTAPMLTIFGQSHLDLAWKWPFEETKRKCARTFSTQLALMDEYPGYKFLMCEPPIIEILKEYYPELYTRVTEKTVSGQIIPEGGFYVESDTNIPSGESLIRQFTFGKKRFKEECGCDTVMAWLPDSFGFSAVLPQIMAGCGIRYFTTQKLLRCHPESDPFPYNIFLWEGNDGSKILTHIYMSNNSKIDPQVLIKRWERDRNQKEDIDTFLFPFGYGDGGGGATRELCELANRLADLEGAPRTKMDSPVSFFEEIEKTGQTKNRWVGELYLQWHRGVYTSLAKLKKGNRRAETAMREAELWSAAATVLADVRYPWQALTKLWEKLLFNQFHDIIAGTSITRVNLESERDLEEIRMGAEHLADDAVRAVIGCECSGNDEKPDGIVLFNSLSWERKAVIKLPQDMTGACDYTGVELPVQIVEDAVYVRAYIPSCGFTTIYPYAGNIPEASGDCCAFIKDGGAVLENEILRIVINISGKISSIIDKETGIEYVDGLCNNFKMFKDVNTEYDAWEIGSMYENVPVETGGNAELEIICTGGRLFAGIRVKKKLNASMMTQDIILESGSRQVDFITEIDWHERHKLLKVEFPVKLHAEEALHEIQFGYVKRPTHKSRRYDADRYEVCNYRYTALAEAGRGFAVLNDCKYGVSTDNGSISLTLLKAPVIPDMYADLGVHEFTYSIVIYNGSFASGGVTQSACELNTPVLTAEGFANHKSLFNIAANTIPNEKNPCDFAYSNIIIETVKAADDNTGDIILRLYESQNTRTSCVLNSAFDIKEVYQANMLEEIQNRLEAAGHSVSLQFRPFEVKTLRLKLK